jgi:hypothetical protein
LEITEFQARNPVCISSECAYQFPGFLYEVSMDARQLARDVARELGALKLVHTATRQ